MQASDAYNKAIIQVNEQITVNSNNTQKRTKDLIDRISILQLSLQKPLPDIERTKIQIQLYETTMEQFYILCSTLLNAQYLLENLIKELLKKLNIKELPKDIIQKITPRMNDIYKKLSGVLLNMSTENKVMNDSLINMKLSEKSKQSIKDNLIEIGAQVNAMIQDLQIFATDNFVKQFYSHLQIAQKLKLTDIPLA